MSCGVGLVLKTSHVLSIAGSGLLAGEGVWDFTRWSCCSLCHEDFTSLFFFSLSWNRRIFPFWKKERFSTPKVVFNCKPWLNSSTKIKSPKLVFGLEFFVSNERRSDQLVGKSWLALRWGYWYWWSGLFPHRDPRPRLTRFGNLNISWLCKFTLHCHWFDLRGEYPWQPSCLLLSHIYKNWHGKCKLVQLSVRLSAFSDWVLLIACSLCSFPSQSQFSGMWLFSGCCIKAAIRSGICKGWQKTPPHTHTKRKKEEQKNHGLRFRGCPDLLVFQSSAVFCLKSGFLIRNPVQDRGSYVCIRKLLDRVWGKHWVEFVYHRTCGSAGE